jgi:hypothetical protein
MPVWSLLRIQEHRHVYKFYSDNQRIFHDLSSHDFLTQPDEKVVPTCDRIEVMTACVKTL